MPACKDGTNMIKTQDTEMGQSSTLLDVTTPITCFRLGTLGVHLLRCCLSPRTRALLVGAHYSYQFLLCTYVSSRSTQHVVLVGVPIQLDAGVAQTWSHSQTIKIFCDVITSMANQ